MRISRAISPVISTVFMIALIVASTSAVMVFLQYSEGTASVTTEDGPAQGQDTTTASSQSVSFEVSKFAKNLNDTYYSSIELKIDYTGPDAYILVYDVDIYVDGIRLDDYSEWVIVDSAAEYTTSGGKFTGYKQLVNTSIVYKVNLTDSSNALARLPLNTGFTYTVALGNTDGDIVEILTETHISVNIFTPVMYNISVLHYKQDINDPNSMLATIINMVKELNGSNKLYYRLNNLTNVYDTSKAFNGTAIAEWSDLVINAEWAVSTNAAAEMMNIYLSGKPMLMIGKVLQLYKDGNVDNSTTQSITGVWYTPHTKNYKTKKYYLTGNYTWSKTNDYLLQSLQGSITFYDNQDYLRSIGKYDDSTNQTTSYGITKYQVYKRAKRSNPPESKWAGNGSLVVSKAANVTASNITLGEVITVPVDDRIFDGAERQILVRNAILSLLVETNRLDPVGTLSIISNKLTDITVPAKKKNPTYWSLQVSFQVLDADVPTTGLNLVYTLPGKYKYTNPNPVVYISRSMGSTVSQSFAVVSKTITLDLSAILSGNLKQGEIVTLLFTGFGEKVKNKNKCYDWTATLNYQQFDLTSQVSEQTAQMKIPSKKYPSYLC